MTLKHFIWLKIIWTSSLCSDNCQPHVQLHGFQQRSHGQVLPRAFCSGTAAVCALWIPSFSKACIICQVFPFSGVAVIVSGQKKNAKEKKKKKGDGKKKEDNLHFEQSFRVFHRTCCFHTLPCDFLCCLNCCIPKAITRKGKHFAFCPKIGSAAILHTSTVQVPLSH